MYDLIIKNGTVIDGTGAPRIIANISIKDGKIVEVGNIFGQAKRIIDAKDKLVTPGWVDIHTHYDGQATWDSYLTPSSWHGVTTSVFGNCGVGFAPVKKGSEKYLINLMEGVEDIPGSVLAEGINFSWQSFPEYIDALEKKPRIMDIGTQIPHGALRFYVMGERGANHKEKPSEEEIDKMTLLTEEGLKAGALGISTSRTTKHKSSDGTLTPSLSADDKELAGIAEGLKRANAGLIQCNSDMGPGEMEILIQAAQLSKRPLSVLLIQYNDFPDRWRETLKYIKQANSLGIKTTGQVGSRPIGVVMGFNTSVNPFSSHSQWKQLKHLSSERRIEVIKKDKELQRILVNEVPENNHTKWINNAFKRTFKLEEPLNYEPTHDESIFSIAKLQSKSPWDIALDHFINGKNKDNFLMHTFENYSENSLNVIEEMLLQEETICGVGDAGAHVATICDASYPTFMVPFWSRDRKRGRLLNLEYLISKQTLKTAHTFGLYDRGVLSSGMKADINIIDYDKISLTLPSLSYDLPSGGKRLVQKSVGYEHTFVAGIEVSHKGEFTGELPGKVIRGSQKLN